MAEQEKSNEERMAEYRRSLNPSHPLNRRQFLRDRIRELRFIGIGTIALITGGGLMYQADQEWDEEVERVCARSGEPNCKETNPELYNQLKEKSDNNVLMQLPGCLGVIGGGLFFLYGASSLTSAFIKRRMQMQKK